jgi:hypothetical protein
MSLLLDVVSNSARMRWSAVLCASALLVLSGSPAAAIVYNYEVTGTFPSDTTPTAFWAPNGRFEFRFSLEPQTLNDIGPESHILLPTEISYFLNGKHIVDIGGPVGFSTGPTVTGFGTNLTFPAIEPCPRFFSQVGSPEIPLMPGLPDFIPIRRRSVPRV